MGMTHLKTESHSSCEDVEATNLSCEDVEATNLVANYNVII